MAKISELVKTYRLLSDPNAPDWNVKFIGGVAVALALVAAAALAWAPQHADPLGGGGAAAAVTGTDEVDAPRACDAGALGVEKDGVEPVDKTDPLPAECAATG